MKAKTKTLSLAFGTATATVKASSGKKYTKGTISHYIKTTREELSKSYTVTP